MNHRFLPLFVLLLGAGSEARGQSPNIHVWFEAVGVNPASTVVQQGVRGGDLILGCETLPGFAACEWDLSMKLEWDTAPMVSVVGTEATDFLGNTDRHTVSDLQVGNYPLNAFSFVEVNTGGVLAETRGIQVPLIGNPPVFVPIPTGEYTFLTARLTTLAAPGGVLADGIDMRVNSLIWTFWYDPAGPMGPDPVVQFGDADPVPGLLEGGLAEDVIVVQRVPALAFGDLNCDGATDLDDIPPFVRALIDPVGYATANPTCFVSLADMNGDGSTNGGDIGLFVHALLAP